MPRVLAIVHRPNPMPAFQVLPGTEAWSAPSRGWGRWPFRRGARARTMRGCRIPPKPDPRCHAQVADPSQRHDEGPGCLATSPSDYIHLYKGLDSQHSGSQAPFLRWGQERALQPQDQSPSQAVRDRGQTVLGKWCSEYNNGVRGMTTRRRQGGLKTSSVPAGYVFAHPAERTRVNGGIFVQIPLSRTRVPALSRCPNRYKESLQR